MTPSSLSTIFSNSWTCESQKGIMLSVCVEKSTECVQARRWTTTRKWRPEQKIGTERDKEGNGEVKAFSQRKPLESVHLSGQVESVRSHWEALHRDRQPSRTAAKVSLSAKKSGAKANCNIMRFIPHLHLLKTALLVNRVTSSSCFSW